MRSIKLKLTLAFSLIIVVPILLITIISSFNSYNRQLKTYKTLTEKELEIYKLQQSMMESHKDYESIAFATRGAGYDPGAASTLSTI